MCIVKAPKIEQPEQKEPEYLRNPFLDVANNDKRNANAIRIGRNALRISQDQSPTVGFEGRSTSSSGQASLSRSPMRDLGINSSSGGVNPNMPQRGGKGGPPGGRMVQR